MQYLSLGIILFMILEFSNILFLYFKPESKSSNSMGVFNAYERSKADPEIHRLVKYLVNWVAGTKLILIAVLLVILVLGDFTTKMIALIALIISVLAFFWRLFPIAREMDKMGELIPRGHSKSLGLMVIGSIVILFVALQLALILKG